MKRFIWIFILLSSFSAQAQECQSTTINAKVKIRYGKRHEQYPYGLYNLTTLGTARGVFILNRESSNKIFQIGDKKYLLNDLEIEDNSWLSSTKMKASADFSSGEIVRMLKDVIGENRLRKKSEIQNLVEMFKYGSSYFNATFHAYEGARYGTINDQTKTYSYSGDSSRNILELMIDFSRNIKCHR